MSGKFEPFEKQPPREFEKPLYKRPPREMELTDLEFTEELVGDEIRRQRPLPQTPMDLKLDMAELKRKFPGLFNGPTEEEPAEEPDVTD